MNLVVGNKFGSLRQTFSQTRVQVGQVIPLFTTRVEMDSYTNNFPGLPCFKKITADKHVLAELPLVPFVIINLTLLTVGICMKVRFKSKVTRGFSFSPLRDSCSPLRGSLMRRKIKKNLWDQGNWTMRNKGVRGIFVKSNTSLMAASDRNTFPILLILELDRSIKRKPIGIRENAHTLW